ncbi:hypothetical protein HKCCE3408_19565, partial [Rhodobacterales bacterium HKCCE3408]|nr:hypothetical protein [Rhodobacterales bacterium HKCCE3408]
MAHGIERLGLDEVEAIARDCLLRAGVAPAGAGATAAAVTAAERNGMRTAGFDRLARLLEGIAMGAIAPGAAPQASRDLPGRITVAARGGLSDPALSLGLSLLEPVVREAGIATLSVTGAGETGHLLVWAERLSEAGLTAVALSATGGLLVMPGGPNAAGPVVPLGTVGDMTAAGALLTALAGAGPGIEIDADLPLDRPAEAALCLVALSPA